MKGRTFQGERPVRTRERKENKFLLMILIFFLIIKVIIRHSYKTLK